MGKLDHDLTVLPSPGNHWLIRDIILFYGRTIQVSELLWFAQIYGENLFQRQRFAERNKNNEKTTKSDRWIPSSSNLKL